MKKYKAKIIEDITSGTLVKTKIIEAKDEDEAQEIVENEGNNDWEEDYNVECGHDNEYSLEEIEAKDEDDEDDEDDEENIFFTEGHIVKRDMQNGKIEDIAFACDSAYANEIAKALNKILDEE